MKVQRLIYEVRKRNFIYNSTDSNHRNAIMLKLAWDEIGEAVGVTATAAKNKWYNLRSNYSREKRLRASKGKVVTWKFFPQLAFLDNSDCPYLKIGCKFNLTARAHEFTRPLSTGNKSSGNQLPALSTGNKSIGNLVYASTVESPDTLDWIKAEPVDIKYESTEQPSTSNTPANLDWIKEEPVDDEYSDAKPKFQLPNQVNHDREEEGEVIQAVNSPPLERYSNGPQGMNIDLMGLAHLAAMTEKAQEEEDDSDLLFLRSLLPSMKRLSPVDNFNFRSEVMDNLKKKLFKLQDKS